MRAMALLARILLLSALRLPCNRWALTEHDTSLVPRLSPHKNRRRRKPGKIRKKSCRLPAPGSGVADQIAEQNHINT